MRSKSFKTISKSAILELVQNLNFKTTEQDEIKRALLKLLTEEIDFTGVMIEEEI